MSRGVHTPGPWMWWDSCSWRRLGSEDQSTCIMQPITLHDGQPDLYFRNGGYTGPDASLIKAAPDLMEACEGLVASMNVCGTHAEILDARLSALAKAVQAINKAKGNP